MSFRLRLGRQAKREMKTLDISLIKRLEKRFQELANDPFDPRISKVIKRSAGNRSSRVGHWRIIFKVDELKEAIEILSIWPRGKAY